MITDAKLNEHNAENYSLLLDLLTLEPRHKAALEKRGFSTEQIENLGYKTYPVRRKSIVEKFIKNYDPSGTPGFWQNATGQWQLAGKAGMMIPVRDINAKISGLKIRADDSVASGKYLMLSSNPKPDKRTGEVKYPNGAAASISVHYPIVGKLGKVLRITEGEIKADMATLISGIYTISIPGVSMWEWVLEAIKRLNPDEIFLAFDADKNKMQSTSTSPDAKPFTVAKCLAKLYLALKQQGYAVKIEDWPEEYGKGIDDVLSAGFEDKVRIMPDDEALEFARNSLQDEMPLDWVYIIAIKRFVHALTFEELDKEQFSDLFAPNFKRGKASDKVLRNQAFPKFDVPIYEPNNLPIIELSHGRKAFNTWVPNLLKLKNGDVSIFIEHCKL